MQGIAYPFTLLSFPTFLSSYRITFLRSASHRIASHRFTMYCIVSYRTSLNRIATYYNVLFRLAVLCSQCSGSHCTCNIKLSFLTAILTTISAPLFLFSSLLFGTWVHRHDRTGASVFNFVNQFHTASIASHVYLYL
jgi:hypothetical protein